MAKKPRDYGKEYETYHAKPQQKKNRAARNTARRQEMVKGNVRKGDGMEVDHKKPLSKGGSNSPSNMQILTRKANREKYD